MMNISEPPNSYYISDKNDENNSYHTDYISILSLNTFFNKKIENKLTYIEKYDKEKIEFILSLSNTELKTLIYDKNYTDQDGNKMNVSVYLKTIRKYLIKIYNNNCEYTTVYYQNNNNRIYSSESAQMFHHKLRGFLCSDLIDYDLKSCHPTIFLFLCKYYGLDFPELDDYINNKDEILKKYKLTKLNILCALNIDNNKIIQNNVWYNNFVTKLNVYKQCIYNKIKDIFDVSTDNEKNPISSSINKLFCYIENYIIQEVNKKFNISVPMFDGFMSEEVIPLEKLNKISKNFGLKWSIKEHNNSIKIPDNFINKDLPIYQYQKEKFEKEVFHIKNNDSYYRIVENDYYQYSRMGLIDLSEQFRILNEKGISIPIWKEWIKDINKRSFNSFIFDPAMKSDPELYYNTFNGFSCKNWKIEKQTEIISFLKLINNLCNHEENVINYIMDYLAHMIQKPAEKSGKIIIFRGLEGVGKDSFHLLIEKILGKKYCLNTENFEDIFGKYNIAIKDKIFICLNETNSDDARKYKDSLKAFATSEKTKYADKNVKAIEQHNYARLFLFTNSSTPVNLEMSSRRYVIIKTGWELLNDTEFWNKFYKDLNDENFIKSVYDYLMNRDISNFKLNSTPITEEYKLIKENTIHPVIEYLKEICDKNHKLYWDFHESTNSYFIKRSEFMNAFEEWCENKHELTDKQLNGKVITNAIKDIGGIEIHKNIQINNKQSRYMSFNFTTIRKFFIKTKIL